MKIQEKRNSLIWVTCALLLLSAYTPVSAQWKKITNIPPPFDKGYYLDVFFLPANPLYGWISGFNGYVLRTTDGGTTWQGTIASQDAMLESVNFVTPLVGYTSGGNGIFKSTDGGVSWSDVTPKINVYSMWGCFFVNQNVGMVVAGGCSDDGQTFIRTTDGGITWSEFRANIPNSGMTDIMLYSQDGLGYGSSSGLIWKTTNGGRSWAVFSQTGPQNWQEEITNINNSFLVPTSGEDCSGARNDRGELRFSTDAGKSWRRYQTYHSMFGSFLINETSGWGVGDGASVYYTSDAGVTWQNRNCGIDEGANLDDTYFVSDSVGWVVGQGVYRTNFLNPPNVKITAQKPLTFCEGDSTILEASSGFTEYTWSNGAVGQKITVKASGMYRVLAYDKSTCREAFDSIEVTSFRVVPPIIQLDRPKPILCDGDTLALSVGSNYKNYKWSNGEITSSIRIGLPGMYSVIVTDSNGCVSESQPITIIAIPPIKPTISAIHNFSFCIGDSLRLSAPDGYSEYHWSNGVNVRQFYTTIGGDFSVTVVDSNGCSGASEIVNVRALDAQNKLEILTVLPDNTFDISPVTLTGRGCRDIVLHNRNDSLGYFLETPFIVKNLLFSIPQSQLPISIPPRGTISLNICFAPVDTLMQIDTLIFPDTCSDISVILRSKGGTYLMGSNTQCNIPVRGVVYQLGGNYLVSPPFPQPSSNNQIQVNYSEQGSSMALEFPPIGTLNDMLGTSLRSSQLVITSRTRGQHPAIEGKFIFDTDGISSGTYYIAIHVGGGVQVMPVLIEK
jgi:photosystem II stability/assembly factor-like uncharacterized protein